MVSLDEAQIIINVCTLNLFLLAESTRERAFNLVAQAFSSINADDFAAYVGLPVTDAIQGMYCHFFSLVTLWKLFPQKIKKFD